MLMMAVGDVILGGNELVGVRIRFSRRSRSKSCRAWCIEGSSKVASSSHTGFKTVLQTLLTVDNRRGRKHHETGASAESSRMLVSVDLQ
jgi:hypothetical protein